MTKFKWTILLVAIVFFAPGIYYSIDQAAKIFESSPLTEQESAAGIAKRLPFEFTALERPDGAQLRAVMYPLEGARGTVLFFHGNSQNLTDAPQFADYFAELGFQTFAVERRGAGNSTGPMSQQALYDDGVFWYDHLRTTLGEDADIRVVGYSMGTTFASYLAAQRDVADLVLFAPFSSISAMTQHRLPILPQWYSDAILRFPLPSDKWLSQAPDTRVRIYHGTADKIVPLEIGARLKSVLGDDDVFVTLDDETHWSIIWNERTKADLAAAWAK